MTTRNLKVLRVDAENNLLLVEGAVPGGPNAVVVIRKAIAAKRDEIRQRMGFGLIGGNQNRKVRLPIDLPSEAGSVEVTYTPGG